jgi:ABC-type multidrug transport system fused ATPase/permease subunit
MFDHQSSWLQGDMNSMERVLQTLEETPWEQETTSTSYSINARENKCKENQEKGSSDDGNKKKKEKKKMKNNKEQEKARPLYDWHTPLNDNDENDPLYTLSSLPSSSDVNNNKDWPVNGVVEFRNVTLRYRPNAPTALKQVSFLVNAGER